MPESDAPPTPRDQAHTVGACISDARTALREADDHFVDDGRITDSERRPLLDALERAEMAIHRARRAVLEKSTGG